MLDYLWVIFGFQGRRRVLLGSTVRAVGGGRAGDRVVQHSGLPRLDGPEAGLHRPPGCVLWVVIS